MKKILVSSLLVLMSTVLMAQSQVFRSCATDEMWEQAVKADPLAGVRRLAIHNSNAFRKLPGTKVVSATGVVQYKIPVVFHVMHTYGAENISKAQIQDAVNSLNLSFQKLNPDTGDVIPLFQPIFGNAEIGFELANIDPSGNCTDGITRTYTELTNVASDNVKALIDWPCEKYLNIWVVKNIASGAAGYAYYPGIASNIDGIVMRHDYTGSFGTANSSNYTERSLSHEVGHWLNLPHTWGSSNTPGLASNCSIDDGIFDTPNTIGVANFTCNTAQSTCGAIDNVQNYMDYASCHKMFTQGQVDEMQLALQVNAGGRDNLVSNSNLIATGTESGHVVAPCSPVADFISKDIYICAGTTVSFNDVSWNGTITNRTWTFLGGSPATDTAASPAVLYSVPGVYDVQLAVANSLGNDTLTRTALVHVLPIPGTNVIPYNEGFETTTIPGNEWEVINENNNNSWAVTSIAAATGTKSMRLVNQAGNGSGSIDQLITPTFDLSNVSGTQFSFKVAFASKNANDSSELHVYFTNNCGILWSQRYLKIGSALATAPATTAAFSPTSSQWRTETINLTTSTYSGKPSVRARFEFVNYVGNNIYIDDINIDGNVVGINEQLAEQFNFRAFPNPSKGDISVSFTTSKTETVKLQVYDMAGRLVDDAVNTITTAGDHNFVIDANNKNGIYLLKITIGDKEFQNRISFVK
jgi:PKD repeat protein